MGYYVGRGLGVLPLIDSLQRWLMPLRLGSADDSARHEVGCFLPKALPLFWSSRTTLDQHIDNDEGGDAEYQRRQCNAPHDSTAHAITITTSPNKITVL